MVLNMIKRYTVVLIACTFIILALLASIQIINQSFAKEEPPVILNKNSQGEYRLTIKLGEPVQQTYQRNPGFFEVGESGFGPGFMYPQLPTSEIPKVRVEVLDEDYQTAFSLSELTDIRFVEDSNYPELGTGHFLAHLPKVDPCQYDIDEREKRPECSKEAISHKLFEQYMQIIKVLKQYDWKPYIDLTSPRILGKDSWEVYQYNRDGYYIDTYEKWQKYAEDGIFVCFYHKNLILEVVISNVAPRLEMYTNDFDYLFRYDENTRGERWKEYLARDIPKWAQERKALETKLKAKGYHIVEDYQDAPLPDYH